MKTKVMLITVLCCVGVSLAGITGPILFSDSFDRPDNVNISASTDGMGGLLSPLVYVEIGDEVIFPIASGSGQPNPDLTNIENNQLHLADGPNMSTLYLDHNFVDSEFPDAGGMRIGLTIVSNQGPLMGIDSFVGFGVGNTLEECENIWFDYNGTGFRGRVNNHAGTSDFWVGWSPAAGGTIQVYKNGPTSEGGENYDAATDVVLSGNDRLELEMYFDSFTAGSPVVAVVLWNSEIVAIDSFEWDHDNANYIGVNARQGNGYTVDDLEVAAIYNDRAQVPAPADGATGLVPEDVILVWNKGKDAEGNPNANVVQHYLYIAEGEPNFIDVSPIIVADMADPVTYDPEFSDSDTDKIYYWRVDQSVLVDDTPSAPNDPNTIVGFVWSFETIKSVPIITSQPANAQVGPGWPAELIIEVESISPPVFEWYKAADPEIVPGLTDVLVSSMQTLTLEDVQASDEGYYYCKVVNAGGETYSNVVTLGVKRKVAHWTLDWADLVDGHYLDSSGEGHHADPNIVPDATAFVAGVDPAKTAEGLDLTVEPLAAAATEPWAIAAFTDELTISLWAKWSVSGGVQGLVCSRNEFTTPNNFFFEITVAGNVQANAPGYNPFGAAMPMDQWVHLVLTSSADGVGVIYIDGIEAARSNSYRVSANDVPVYIGAAGQGEAGTLYDLFNGVLDDIQIYNYAMDQFEAADLYYAVSETPVCINPDGVDLSFDHDGDCRVSLSDFVMFAGTWLNCGWYPQSECP